MATKEETFSHRRLERMAYGIAADEPNAAKIKWNTAVDETGLYLEVSWPNGSARRLLATR